MRISTPVFYQRSVTSMLDKQGSLSQQNQYLSTTKRVLTGSDDPVAIATIQRLNQDISVGEQYLKNADSAEAANYLEETALTQVTNVMQRVRELTITAGNDTYNEKNRAVIARELEELLKELVGVANTQDGNNQYIFAGFEVDTKPFQANEFGGIDYHGNEGTSDYQVGSGIAVQGYDAGSSIFSGIKEGNGTFISEAKANNVGSGVISEGSVIDDRAADDYIDQDYTITISKATGADEPQYSVYGLDETSVSGEAHVSISEVDLNDASIANVNPKSVYPATDSAVSIEFIATTNANEFEIKMNGVSSLPNVYDSSEKTTQNIKIDGVSIEVNGVPNSGDQYTMTKYIDPTLYEAGQSIHFNGIKTELKGDVFELDSFTLRQSDEKNIFATIQDVIDTLNIPGESEAERAQRSMGIETAILEIDNGMNNVSYFHMSVGTRLNTIESQRETTLDFNLTKQTTLSHLEDLDMAAAISEFQLQNSMLEVSQQTFIQLQSLSLFKLI